MNQNVDFSQVTDRHFTRMSSLKSEEQKALANLTSDDGVIDATAKPIIFLFFPSAVVDF